MAVLFHMEICYRGFKEKVFYLPFVTINQISYLLPQKPTEQWLNIYPCPMSYSL